MVLKLEKNIEHSYKKVGNDKGKLLVLFEPAGFENYFRDLNIYHIILIILSPIDEQFRNFR